MDEKRAKRIEATLERCGISLQRWPSLISPHLYWGLVARISDTGYEINLCVNGSDNATRLASELRGCGMIAFPIRPYEHGDPNEKAKPDL
jgi:hypothetical protein